MFPISLADCKLKEAVPVACRGLHSTGRRPGVPLQGYAAPQRLWPTAARLE
jgi:hypothetical protein